MATTQLRFLSILLVTALLGACGQRLDVEVKARIDGQPAAQAKVVLDREEGVTEAKGELVYLYQTQPAKGAEVDVAKTGYSTYRATRQFEPGQVIEVALNRQTVVAIKALTDEYGRTSGVPGLSVSIDGKTVGKTDAQGSYTYDYRGEPGKKAVIALSAPGYVPAVWKTTVRNVAGRRERDHG